jgi:hypothetical protein
LVDVEDAIKLLTEQYPQTFFLDPPQRRPIKNNIIADLIKDGVALAPELLSEAVGRYQSHFGYQLALQTGVRRIDLEGKEDGTVTESEHRTAQKYVRERRQEQQEPKPVVTKPMTKPTTESDLSISKPPLPLLINNVKATPKVIKSDDPLAPITDLLDALRGLPEPLRGKLVAAGLREVKTVVEQTIQRLEQQHD